MMPPAETRAGLKAIQHLFVFLRNEALDRDDRRAANLFDAAEYLPALMLEAGDATERFGATLRGLAKTHDAGLGAFNRFQYELGRPQATREELNAEPVFRPHPDSDPHDPFPLRWVRVDADGTTAEVDPAEAFGEERAAEMRDCRERLAARRQQTAPPARPPARTPRDP